MTLLAVFIAVTLGTMLLIATVNAVTFPRLRNTAPEAFPTVSILIPARNEERTIADTINRILLQNYPDFEVILLDDGSTDNTVVKAQSAARSDERFRVVSGEPLPERWLGKPWACEQLGRHARGDVLVFTDADVIWYPHTLSSIIALRERYAADMLTVWPTQITETWSERLCVPLLALTIIGYLPELCVRYIKHPGCAAAVGQLIVFDRSVYQAIGRHESVRQQLVEDIGLGRRTKACGYRLVEADGAGNIACHMYRGWREVRNGFARTILAGYGGNPWLLVLGWIFHWIVFLVPWFWFAWGFYFDGGTMWPTMPVILASAGVLLRAITAAVTRQRIRDAVLMPISVVLMSIIAARSLWWHARGGAPYKGRTVVHRE